MSRVKQNRIGRGKAPKVQPAPPVLDDWWNVEVDDAAIEENRLVAKYRADQQSIRIQSVTIAFVLSAMNFLGRDAFIPSSVIASVGTVGLLAIAPIHTIRMRKLAARHAAARAETFQFGQQREVAPRRELTERQRQLQAELRKAATDLRRYYSLTQWVFCICVGSPALLMVIHLGFFVLLPVNCLIGVAILCIINRKGDAAATRAILLIKNSGAEVLGAVIDFLESTEARLHGPALGALPAVVSSVRASDGPSLAPEHRRWLYGWLNPDRARANPRLALAVLQMVEQLGDAQAEPAVLSLMSQLHPSTPEQTALVNAAHAALSSLRHADETLSKRGTLLSPAFAPASTETLLHIPTASGAQPEQLLRSTSSGDET